MKAVSAGGRAARGGAVRHARAGGFTLIELLVILTIIAMILTMALPSIVGLIRSSRIGAAADIIQASVSYARSSAISSNRSSTLDLANSASNDETERVLVSVTVVADDFERYPTNIAALEQYFEDMQVWEVEPSLSDTGWLVVTGRTRELRAGHRDPSIRNAYAWNLNTEAPPDRSIDDVSVVRARFRVVSPGPPDSPDFWGFGVLANLTRTSDRCVGYRLAVRGKTNDEGFSIKSEVALEKVFNPSNPTKDHAFEAVNPPADVEYVRTLDIPGQTAVLTSGVWYWLKLQSKRQKRVVSLAGKFWIGEASDEPEDWTLGPAYDLCRGGVLPKGVGQENFPEEALVGGTCGVWAEGAEISVDDFTVESQKGWALPARVLLQPVALTVDIEAFDYKDPTHLEVLDPYMPGSFPVTYLPDGSAEYNQDVLVKITDMTDARKRRIVAIGNTGKAEGLD